MTYSIDVRAGIVTISGDEATNSRDVASMFSEMLTDLEYRAGFGFLYDRRHLSAPSADLVHGFVDHLQSLAVARWSKVAVVVMPDDPTSYGMMRMMQLLAWEACIEVSIFFDVRGARAWLIESQLTES